MFGSTKKKHIFDSYTTPLLVNADVYKQYESNYDGSDETPWPSLVQQTVASSITQNRNISTDLIDNMINGVFTKSRAMYTYGLRGENPELVGGYVRGLPKGKVVFIPSGSNNQVKARIQAIEGQPIYLNSVVLDEEDDGLLWYEVTYYLLDSKREITGDLKTWLYRESDGTYPELNVDVKYEDEVSPYYPIVPIREHNQRISETNQDLYRTGRHCLRLIGINYDDLDAAVHDDGNVDLGFLDHCYVIVAADIASKVPNTNLYLFDYFKKLYYESSVKKEDFLYWQQVTAKSDPENPLFIPPPPPTNRLEVSDGNYKMVLGWMYIEKSIKTGSVASVNSVKKFITNGVDTVYSNYEFNNDVLCFQKQISETQYEELKIHGLIHTNYIGTAGKTLRTSLSQAFTRNTNDDKNNFIIPLRIDVMRQMGSIKGHDLMYDSVRMVFNSHEIQKLKWYQTGLFKVVVVVIAVAISVITAGTGSGAIPFLSMAMAGVALTTAVITTVLVELAPILLKAMEDLLGPEFALVVAIIISYVIADFTGGITNVTHVQAAVTAVSGAKQIQVADALEDIQRELQLLEQDKDIQEIRAKEADRIANTVWATRNIDETSHMLKLPNNFIKSIHMEPSISIDLAGNTRRFVDRMQFLDKPYSPIKLGLKPYGT